MAMAAIKIETVEATPKARKWLAERISKGSRERLIEIHKVTPELAAAMLERNEHNRPYRAAKVAQYVAFLAHGQWRLTHQGIAFSNEGILIDGQNRLSAIIESGIAAEMTITFGCDPEEFKVVDAGAPRTVKDMLHIEGKKNPALRAAIARRIAAFDSKENSPIPAQTIVEFEAGMNQEMLDDAIRWAVKGAKVTTPMAIGMAYMRIASMTAHKERIEEFFDLFATGAIGDKRNAILQVRNVLIGRPDFGQRAHTQRAIKEAAIIIQAWNRWLINKPLGKFAWPHSLSLPEAT